VALQATQEGDEVRLLFAREFHPQNESEEFDGLVERQQATVVVVR
jgi:hypothetical protein